MTQKDARTTVQEATNFVSSITPSVITLAIAAGVSAEKFAKALVDHESQGDFLVALTSAYMSEDRAAHKKEEKTSK